MATKPPVVPGAPATSGTAATFPDCVPELVGDGIILRAPSEADIPYLVEQCQDPASQQFVPLPNPYGVKDAREFLRGFVREEWESGVRQEFVIDVAGPKDQTTFGGTIALRNHGNGRYEIGFIAHPATRGKGVMTRAGERLITYAFADLGAQMILWRAYEGNEGSRRVAQKLGFTIHEPIRKWAVNHGVLVDEWLGTLLPTNLSEEWRG